MEEEQTGGPSLLMLLRHLFLTILGRNCASAVGGIDAPETATKGRVTVTTESCRISAIAWSRVNLSGYVGHAIIYG